ncbi:MAG: MarR family transcriptional regulator [Chloroflexota bacterium]|nr:MarR family transcriptional regulator [Chloroflexota bacterium]
MSASARTLVDEIVAELAPFIARRQRFMARQWCRQAVSMTHLHVLLLLETEGPLTMGRLAEHLDASLPSVTGIVTRMEERGLVQRTHGEDDRRLVLVRLTDTGRAALEETDFLRRQHVSRVLETLSPEQQRNLLRAIRDLRTAFEQIEPEAPSQRTAAPTH